MKLILILAAFFITHSALAEETTQQDSFIPTLNTTTNTDADNSGDSVNYPPPSDRNTTEADIQTDPTNKKKYCKYCQKNKLRLGNDHSSTRISRQSRQIVTEQTPTKPSNNNNSNSDSTKTRNGR